MRKEPRAKARAQRVPGWHDDRVFFALLVASGILFGWFSAIW